MKDKTPRESRLFALLVKNYLLFTLTLLVIAAGVYLLWEHQLNRLLSPVDWDALIADERLADGRYDEVARRLNGEGNGFSVLDETGTVLYCSDPEVCVSLTPGELACVSPYDGSYYIEAFPEQDADGETRYRVLRYTLEGDTPRVQGEMLLDARFRVISGGLEPGRTAYTPREYGILSGAYPARSVLYRQDFTAQDGSLRTLLLQIALPYQQVVVSIYRVMDHIGRRACSRG